MRTVRIIGFGKSFRVSSFLTGHTENSLAYRFEDQNSSFVFTGDTIYSDGLVQFCENTDLLISECSFPAGWKTDDHMTADLVGLLSKKAKVKQLVFTHQYPPAHDVDIKSQIGEFYQGKITEAKDGASFTL